MATLAGPAGSGAGGTVTKHVGAVPACLTCGTDVLVHPCTCMLFAFSSNLNLCNFRRCDLGSRCVFNRDPCPKGQM